MLPSPTQLKTTVHSFPPSNVAGAVGPMLPFVETYRSPILPPRGTKERERILRIYDGHDYNTLWQGARSGLAKKLASVPYTINGESGKAQYYHDLFGQAHFSQGWQHLIKLAVRDYLSQDYGAIFEISGPGEADSPLLEAPTGINHLDAGRCYVTGNPIYPILYYSLWDGKLHKMHASRVYMLVDDPNPDERYFGIGTCALSRAISIAQREIYMGQYVDTKLDDKPNPGLLIFKNVSESQYQNRLTQYLLEQQNEEKPVFGRTLTLFGLDPNVPTGAESIPFSQPPDKFDFVQYVNLDVDALALALGVDRQELWQLTGSNLGSGAQSQVLAEKARGKAFGDLLTGIERMINWAILPPDLEFKFEFKDPSEAAQQATIDLQYAQIAQTLSTIPGISTQAIVEVLAQKSQTYKDAFTNERGQVDLPSADPMPLSDATSLEDSTPVPDIEPNQPALLPAKVEQKEFSGTASAFEGRFIDIVSLAADKRLARSQFETLLMASLERAGRDAMLDGLKQGGVTVLDDTDEAQLQSWLVDQIDFVDKLGDEVFSVGIAPSAIPGRAVMWSNKSLRDIYSAGVVSADRNGLYMWELGKTEKHCPDCLRLNKQVHRFKEWYSRGWLPQSNRLQCHGYNCDCRLKKTTESAWGRF